MLRIILWKIGFEWAHLRRILWPASARKVYYFAFGANLSPQVLEQRRIRIFESFDYALADAGLRFSQAGFYREHGYASADAAPGERVYGKMYRILERDALRMDYFEGVPWLEAHEKLFHSDQGVDFFFYRALNPETGLKPTREYLDYLVDAYREMEIVPQAYLEAMAETEVLEEFRPQDKTGDFVRNIEAWPTPLHPVLVAYEGFCLWLVEWLWNRSLVHWMIRYENRESGNS